MAAGRVEQEQRPRPLGPGGLQRDQRFAVPPLHRLQLRRHVLQDRMKEGQGEGHRQFQPIADRGDEACRGEGVSAEREEVVVAPGVADAKDLAPDAGEPPLGVALRRGVEDGARLARPGGRALRSTLPLGFSGRAGSTRLTAAGTIGAGSRSARAARSRSPSRPPSRPPSRSRGEAETVPMPASSSGPSTCRWRRANWSSSSAATGRASRPSPG